jgi:hypothetical protein
MMVRMTRFGRFGICTTWCALGFSALAIASVAAADGPPAPDFFWPYGRVQLLGANIVPEVQPVVAIIAGKTCGLDQTRVATVDPGNPPEDIGKTVYVVDVLSGGTGTGQRAGCGRAGDPVTLYFPKMHRFARQQPAFQQGGLRVNLDLGPELSNRVVSALAAADGTQ